MIRQARWGVNRGMPARNRCTAALGALVYLGLSGCASRTESAREPHLVREGTPDAVNIAIARERGVEQQFAWAPWSKATFERAALDEQGRWLGGYLMALDEAGYLQLE